MIHDIKWFHRTKDNMLYILPTIIYVVNPALKPGTNTIMGKATVINFVWLYWTIGVMCNFKPN